MLRLLPRFLKGLPKLVLPTLALTLAIADASPAEALEWALNKAKSRVSFEAHTGDKIVTGEFEQFEANLRFDPDYLEITDIAASIDINTITTGQPKIDEALRSKGWFDAQTYPVAGFRSSSVTKAGADGMFIMNGNLTIKGRTQPVTIPFSLNVDLGEGTVVGETAISRRSFNIGPDGPISGVIVGDLVKIRLDLVATRLDN